MGNEGCANTIADLLKAKGENVFGKKIVNIYYSIFWKITKRNRMFFIYCREKY